MVKRQVAEQILKVYEQAWVEQDTELILTIFHEDAVYGEYLLEKEGVYYGHEGIEKYWVRKVVGEQSKIEFELLNLFVDGDVVIAEWDAKFYSNEKKKYVHLREVAIIEIVDEKIKSFREYWHSE